MANNKSLQLDVRFDVITVIIKKSLIKKISEDNGISGKIIESDIPENKNIIKVEHIKDAF